MLTMVKRLVLSSHPGPTLAVTMVASVMAIALGFEPWRLLLLVGAVLAGQLSIGWSNDWIDAGRDRQVGRSDKPVALGLIPVATVRFAALVSAAATVALSLMLGWQAALAHLVLVGSGWGYNVWLKRTPYSVLPFIVSFGLLPSVVTLASTVPVAAAPWANAVGAVFGVAIHFTNVLPDLVDDAGTGVRGLPHRFGRVGAGIVAFGALFAASLLVVAGQLWGAGAVPAPLPPLAIIAFVTVIAIVGWGIVLTVTRRPSRLLFRLIILAAFIIVVQAAVSGVRLTA